MTQPDIIIVDHDDIVFVTPATNAGRAFIKTGISDEARQHHQSICVKQGAIQDIIRNAMAQNINVKVEL